ncbi:hypothetical protein J437_LFUL016988 [Ladona fulva]|uniref:Peptidase metallopeptidase domain-containing protein n=1 Tax=Ladona fulva TaxID=123851 RepID=A0A8K0KJZ8_LADFU|nr:hypothetical protein J437_LFUL016988 [Ladona fulva]
MQVPPNPKLMDPSTVKRELWEALNVWAENSKLTFQMVDYGDADIDIEFSRGGDAHFDDDELWMASNSDIEEGTSLFSVAAHEFGHSLGLSHSSVEGALMYPWYQGTRNADEKFRLPDDDRFGIEQLYGRKHDRPYPTRGPRPMPSTTTTTTLPPPRYTPPTHRPRPDRPHPRPERPQPPKEYDKPNTCDTSYDAISLIRGELFIFKGRYFWRLNKDHMRDGYPVEISRFWPELPANFTHIDAAYERLDKMIVFFIGLPESLEKVDGAMVWGHNSKTYFFSGTMYWRLEDYTGKVELDYPRDMKMWRGVGYNIDSVFKDQDGVTYFFKGKGFWKFNDRRMRVDKEAQLSSASYWMHCPVEEEREFVPENPYEPSRSVSICVCFQLYVFICIYEFSKFLQQVTSSEILGVW